MDVAAAAVPHNLFGLSFFVFFMQLMDKLAQGKSNARRMIPLVLDQSNADQPRSLVLLSEKHTRWEQPAQPAKRRTIGASYLV